MLSKRQKMTAKRGQASEEPASSYDHEKFFNESTTEKFGLISKNRSFIKEKGFHQPDDFFLKTIANKGNLLHQLPQVWCENSTPTSPPMF